MAEVKVVESIELDAPPAVAFAYRLDFTTLPDYNPHVANVRRTDGGTEPGVGAEYAFDLTLPGAPEPMETPLRVVAAEQPTSLTIEVGPGYMAREVCRFDPNGAGTLLTFEQTITLDGEVPDDVLQAIHGQAAEQARLELDLIKKNLG